MQEMQETQVQSLGGEDLPEKSMTTHSSILAWRIPWTEEPDGHDWSNWAHSFANLRPALQPHGLQHTRLPCPSLSSRICSNSCHWVHMLSSHLILYCPLLLLPSFFLSIRVLSNESALSIRWPKYCSFIPTIYQTLCQVLSFFFISLSFSSFVGMVYHYPHFM